MKYKAPAIIELLNDLWFNSLDNEDFIKRKNEITEKIRKDGIFSDSLYNKNKKEY